MLSISAWAVAAAVSGVKVGLRVWSTPAACIAPSALPFHLTRSQFDAVIRRPAGRIAAQQCGGVESAGADAVSPTGVVMGWPGSIANSALRFARSSSLSVVVLSSCGAALPVAVRAFTFSDGVSADSNCWASVRSASVASVIPPFVPADP